MSTDIDNATKELNQDKDIEVSMLKQALQRYEMKVERQKTTISDRFQENEILKAQRFRETLKQENGIVQLRQNLEYYLLWKNCDTAKIVNPLIRNLKNLKAFDETTIE
ncbi:hypothetical protein HA402_002176 [Bradysia odoriphaga]|nr:hypothetical protein HA402_002176 [Bradysia odoriphaga]